MANGARLFWTTLRSEGVEVVFGYPGAAVLPLYDALRSGRVRHVLCRHEQGAAHMADGYARASGRVGVALATSGPGATNLMTGIATARRDSIPVVFLTGQVARDQLQSDAFQEVDTVAIARPITKHAERVTDVADLAPALRRAFHLARSGRPGPVLVDICRNAQTDEAPPAAPPGQREAATADAETSVRPLDDSALADIVTLANGARRPVILAGHGVILSGAAARLRTFAERTDSPVASTLLGLGGFPSSHPLALGLMGMHGTAAANHAIQSADLLIACGMRFDDRVTGHLARYAPRARKVHIDVDGGEIGRRVPVDVGLVADLEPALAALTSRVRPRRHAAWRRRIETWVQEGRARDIVHRAGTVGLHGPHVIETLSRLTQGRALVTTDVGQHQMWTAQYLAVEGPRRLITSGGLGTMGFGLPAAIGAQLARPEDEVWAIVGDGGFQMTQAELATAVQEQTPIRIAVLNNGFLGMVRQWQELFYERRYVATPLAGPDFVALAAAHGLAAERVTRRSEIEGALQRARQARGPALVEFLVEPEGLVYPMVPAGAALDDMLRRPLEPEAVAV